MEPKEIADRMKEKFPLEVQEVSDFGGQVSVSVSCGKILDICRFLYDDPDISMDYLSDLCGVDYPERKLRFEVVYNLYSLKYRHRIRVKALVPEDSPYIDSVISIWSGANWHEREACDMYGIVFQGHPDLRRILMPDDWEGYPQRKDYPLQGPEDYRYRSYEELKDLHSHDKEWTISEGEK